MERNPKKIVMLLILLIGPILILLSFFFPCFIFSGIAENAHGTVQVSGEVSAFGSGRLYSGKATVMMWSSATHWSSAESDFWFGYLSVIGLVLVSISALFLLFVEKPKISMLLTFIGCAMVATASIIVIVGYKPQIFVITGFIYGAPSGIDIALLHGSQAVVEKGSGPWLSLFGAFPSTVGMVLAYYWKKPKGGEKI